MEQPVLRRHPFDRGLDLTRSTPYEFNREAEKTFYSRGLVPLDNLRRRPSFALCRSNALETGAFAEFISSPFTVIPIEYATVEGGALDYNHFGGHTLQNGSNKDAKTNSTYGRGGSN